LLSRQKNLKTQKYTVLVVMTKDLIVVSVANAQALGLASTHFLTSHGSLLFQT
jgi:hypothetical protein